MNPTNDPGVAAVAESGGCILAQGDGTYNSDEIKAKEVGTNAVYPIFSFCGILNAPLSVLVTYKVFSAPDDGGSPGVWYQVSDPISRGLSSGTASGDTTGKTNAAIVGDEMVNLRNEEVWSRLEITVAFTGGAAPTANIATTFTSNKAISW